MCAGDAHSQEVMRKRDKKKAQATVKAVRMKQHRLLLKTQTQRMERPSGRLRERQRCKDALSAKSSGGGFQVVKWAPSEGSVVEVDQSAGESCPRSLPANPRPHPLSQPYWHRYPHTAPALPQAGSSSVCTLTKCQRCSRGWRRS